jgi:quercetin dioxygenase-like cupin family protein
MNFPFTLSLSLVLLAPAIAQTPVSIENEPRHYLEFENSYVRLFRVRLAPGATTLFHVHVNDNVGVRLTDAELSDVAPGGTPKKVSVTKGGVGFGHYPSPLTHSVSNVGSTPFHNMVVEILPSKSARFTAPLQAVVTGHTLELENERVRVFRLILAPGQATEQHSHDRQFLGVAITDGEIAVNRPATDTETVTFRPGDYRWHERGARHSLKNAGSTTFETVEIELKGD